MTIYRDAGHCIARVMSIETNDGTAKSGWQMRYQAGFPETRGEGSGLSAEERFTQDAMTRGMLHRELTDLQWNVLVAKYSINDLEVAEAVRWLIPRVESPAHRLFVTKAVTAWAVPKRLPEAFYVLHSWDADGTPESTLRRWRGGVGKWLGASVDSAFKEVEQLLKETGLCIEVAA
ncbi:MAG: hypothetical protein V7756_09670 [Halopseudomonas sp.]|uniref:hypothetical protein n=1 Tax=Halopseudomonas sp. TaxID=2901191 RepID=UPI003002CE2F